MRLFGLTGHYLAWHYGKAISKFFQVWKNFLWFFYHFFSIGLLGRTLFSPFRRLHEQKKGGFDIANFASSLVINLIMRIVGFLMRSILIIIGLVTEVLVVAVGIASFVIWLSLPGIILILLISGVILFFR